MNQHIHFSRKGFTLMEILFVLLIIALIVSFAAPAFRSIRFEIKNARAKSALKKLADARRSYYQYSKGVDIETDATKAGSHFTGSDAVTLAQKTCSQPGKTGIPASAASAEKVEQLFACGFLDWRDFVGLPYTFYVCNLSSAGTAPCNAINRYAAATGTADAGPSYSSTSGYAMYVARFADENDTFRLDIRDTNDN